jgi:hypothetical protein
LTVDGRDPRQDLFFQLEVLFSYLFHIKNSPALSHTKARGYGGTSEIMKTIIVREVTGRRT